MDNPLINDNVGEQSEDVSSIGLHSTPSVDLNAQQTNIQINNGGLDTNQTPMGKIGTGSSLSDVWGMLVRQHPIFFSLNIALVIILAAAVIWLANAVITLGKNDYTGVKESINELEEEMREANKATTEEIYKFNGQLNRLSARVDDILVLYPSGSNVITIEENDVVPTGAAYGVPEIKADESIGVDVNGKEYRPNELVGKTVLLAYTEDEYEVFFYGQINDSYHWDGYCVTNAYYSNDGELFGICESNFDDGKRLDYISLYRNGKSTEYTYASRVLYNGKNEGETIIYNIDSVGTRVFSYDNIRATDIIYVNSFLRDITGKRIVKYYNGTTINNKYDDETGESYSIEFDENEEVIRVYHGNHKNGNWEDSSKRSYVIKYDFDANRYYIKHGPFSNNKSNQDKPEYLSDEELEEYKSKIVIDDFKLVWK
jgi:hypothetical protein